MSDRSDAPSTRTPRHAGWINATIAGCAVAGPVYTVFMLDLPDRWSDAPLWLVVWGGMSVIVGCVAVATGIIPIALMVWAGWWIGCRTRIGRYPLLWAAVGSAIGFVVIPLIAGSFLPRHPPVGGVVTGYAIGLATWRFIRWED